MSEWNSVSGPVPGIESVRTDNFRALTQWTKLGANIESKAVTANQPVHGFTNDGVIYLIREYSEDGHRWRAITEPKTGHIDTEDLGAEDPSDDTYSSPNTPDDAATLCDELLGGHDLSTDDWGEGFSREWVWDEDGEEPVVSETTGSTEPSAEYASSDGFVSKRKAVYRLVTDLTGGDPFMVGIADIAVWKVRHVVRSSGDGYFFVFESAASFAFAPNSGDSDAGNLRSDAIALDPPEPPNQTLTPEGEAATADLSFVEDGVWPAVSVCKGGFAAYVQDGSPVKVFRKETASGSFAGNGVDDPARSYSGAQEFTSEGLGETDRTNPSDYDLTFSDDVPWRYARGPLPDQRYRLGDTARTGFVETGRTETTRSFRRTVFDGDGDPVHDDITFTLSDELPTAELRAAADDLAEAGFGGGESEGIADGLAAAKWLSSDETFYIRRRSDSFIRLNIPFVLQDDFTVTVTWNKTAVTESGESVSPQSESITIPAGELTKDGDPRSFEGTEGERTFLTELQCDPVESLAQPIWLSRTD